MRVARYKYMLIGGLAPCHNTLQPVFVRDRIKRLDAILKSIRKQKETKKKKNGVRIVNKERQKNDLNRIAVYLVKC